ncbi:MAG: hypothetical protein ACFFCT_14480, partial [Candidatus Odinarchaeota archaeon]
MIPDRILGAYEQLSAAPLPSLPDSIELSIVVCDENGFRLILTRVERGVQLDAEICMPGLEITAKDDSVVMTEKYQMAAVRSIRLLEFVVSLVEHGFSLSMEESEFL